MTGGIDAARAVLRRAVDSRMFPAAAFEVGASGGLSWNEALGTLTLDEGAKPAKRETIFDLASLTKPIATTSVAMGLVSRSRLLLDEPLTAFFADWRGADREHASARDLLEHASGLPARLVDPPPETRREFEHDICTIRLEYEPRTRSVYSDLGFILLGFLEADRGGCPLDAAWDAIRQRLSGIEPALEDPPLIFTPRFRDHPEIAPTWPLNEDGRRGRMLVGEVHDNYAAALGGVAGHAGLFGSVGSVGAFARVVLRAARGDGGLPEPFAPALIHAFTTKSPVPGSSRALGWDTMLPTSSCGTRMSRSAFGHVGFTGTSLWIDPDRDRYFVLLTNRACGGGTPGQMREVRRAFHDALGDV